jgi:hypothetical protein
MNKQRREILKMCSVLLGAALSPSIHSALTADLEPNSATGGALLSASERQTIAVLAELIIPTTDTPGAIAAGVPEFIVDIVDTWFNETERQIFLAGLQELERRAVAEEGVPFSEASEKVQTILLREQEQAAQTYRPPESTKGVFSKEHDPNTPFFTSLKQLVVVGYYTSEIGCKQEQIYVPMPGQYEGNLNYSDFGRRFSS